MIKTKINFLMTIFFIFVSSSFLSAQSDYDIVQGFKNKQNQIEQSIKNANSNDELNNIESQISKLRSDYLKNKELLDKSLYPIDFETSIENLKTSVTLRKGDYVQIDVLQTKVTQLQSQVDELNAKNTELINQVQRLESESKKDKSRISQLEKSIAELKSSLRKRDELVMNMLDSLILNGDKDLTAKEKQEIYSEAKKNNVVENIKRSVRDNIKFLEVTTLTREDIDEIKKQQNDYEKLWKNVGPKIVDIYSEKGENVNSLKEIDSSFTKWHDALNMQVWNTIRNKFSAHNINLGKFSTGRGFTAILSGFIDDEIKNAKVKSKSEAESAYNTFADTVWFGDVKPNWVPFLIDNKMLSEDQKDSIDNKISQWKDEVNPGGFNWLYLIIGVLVIVVVVMFFVKRKPKEIKIVNDDDVTQV